MEEQYYVDRSQLRELWLEHPEWSKRKLAERIGRSKSWVKKWLHRIRSATLEDQEILNGQSRARKHPSAKIAQEVVERILDLRDQPPENLKRTPGPLTILHYLKQDETLKLALPRSTRTVWEILDRHHRILHRHSREHDPEERPAPGVEWGMDFKDVTSVPADPLGKQKHVVEILNFVDHGSSEVVASVPRDDYSAETALCAIAGVLQEHGCPDRIRLDRDTRWVGSWTATDFPAPVLRFFMCLGIDPRVCPPQRPDKNPFVERYHRNFKYECERIEQPKNLSETVEVNQRYVRFYNYERPNQAITCGNLPPRVKFPQAPDLLPPPDLVDPDRWLSTLTGKTYKRRLNHQGCFRLGNQTYYVQQKLRGAYVIVWVDGTMRELSVFTKQQFVKKLPIKGLQNRKMQFPEFLEYMSREAVSAYRHALQRNPHRWGGSRCA